MRSHAERHSASFIVSGIAWGFCVIRCCASSDTLRVNSAARFGPLPIVQICKWDLLGASAAFHALSRYGPHPRRAYGRSEIIGRGNRNLGANSTKVSKAASNAIIRTSVSVSLAVNPPDQPHTRPAFKTACRWWPRRARSSRQVVVRLVSGFGCGWVPARPRTGPAMPSTSRSQSRASSLNPP